MPLNYGLPNRPTHPRPRPIHLLNFLPRNYLVGLQIFRLRLPGRRTRTDIHFDIKNGASRNCGATHAHARAVDSGEGEGKEIGRADNAGPISRSRSLHFDRQHTSIPHALALQEPRSLHFWMIPFRLSFIPPFAFLFSVVCKICVHVYRAEKKSWYVVARNVFLLLLNFSAWPCLGAA